MQYTERELIQRALRRTFDRGYGLGQPRWVAVKDLFSVGKNEAHDICTNYGFNPETLVGFGNEDPHS